uniref:Pentacotripeptide-repeat region of PRORP domain-containing protein n=1 Tax=Brassica campestris TaxID=3711 RepID=A5JVC4_BRACM|nr:hypothetical protein [Brassica rapa]
MLPSQSKLASNASLATYLLLSLSRCSSEFLLEPKASSSEEEEEDDDTKNMYSSYRKAFALVQPRFSGTGTSIGSSSDRNFSYKEKLRSGLVDIKKDDAVALFQSMIQSRPLPTVVDFSRLFSGIARTKQYDLVLSLCKQMESNGIAHDNYSLNIMINCFCRRRKLGFAFSVFGKMLKLGYEPTTVTFSTLINGLCLEGRVSEAVELVDRIGCSKSHHT